MATIDLTNPFWQELACDHADWLSAFDERHLRNWERMLSVAPESAMCEAAVRRFLATRGVNVSPNEVLDGSARAPDFRCESKMGNFYVEVTSISIDRATNESGIPEENRERKVIRATSLNEPIFESCKRKASQCSDADAPVLLAIGTAHSAAAMLKFSPPYPDMVLCGDTTMTVTLNRTTLTSEGGIRLDSELGLAAFLKPDRGNGIVPARSSISGLLLCGITLGETPQSMWVVGLLNPYAARSFDPVLLPGVRFGRVEVDKESSTLRTSWN